MTAFDEPHWIVDTKSLRTPMDRIWAGAVREAIEKRQAMVTVQDLFGATCHIMVRQIEVIFETSAEIRHAAREYDVQLASENKADRKQLKREYGIFDPEE